MSGNVIRGKFGGLVTNHTNCTLTNNCLTGSFTSGTTIGPCTATPNAGSVFAGWTGTLGCTGTGACTASLTGNSTMNAVFNLAPTGAQAPGITLSPGMTVK